ncbi:hypothetical protein MNV49_003616 [Pseudohyphozyma bogoriensis]|nr:hypothetical protein MNV49_003616 [Pseudohyphozyma bogoriensis]
MPDGWMTNMVPTGTMGRNYAYFGRDGGRYLWKSGGGLSGHWTCIRLDTGDVVAEWSRSISMKKDGNLTISGAYNNEAEVLLGTALAAEEFQKKKMAIMGAL